MSVNRLEELLLSLINFIPYAVFIIYVFDSDLKVSRLKADLVLVLSSVMEACIWIFIPTPNSIAAQIVSLIITIGSFIFYISVVKIDFFHAVFRLLVVNNTANFIVAEAKFLEGRVFPKLAWEMSCWSYALCIFLLQIVILGSFTFFWKKRFCKNYHENFNPAMWRYLCFIPVTFYVVWHYVMYHTGNASSLEIALSPLHAFYQTIIFGGQILTYICVYKLIIANNKLIELEMEKNFLSVQTMQYQSFQKHLNEIRIIRHDIRHHLQMIASCVESGNTLVLKEYLRQYTKVLDDEVINQYCQNVTLNLILNYYAQMCKENSIDFDVAIGAGVQIESILSEDEIAILFGNLLENAYDACLQQAIGKRKIVFCATYKKGLIFTIDNTFKNQISKDSQNRFLSTKHSGYGLGTISAQNIVQRHNGIIRFDECEENFCVSVLLPSNSN